MVLCKEKVPILSLWDHQPTLAMFRASYPGLACVLQCLAGPASVGRTLWTGRQRQEAGVGVRDAVFVGELLAVIPCHLSL